MMEAQNTTVSVVIPAFNTAPYIAETLDSVFAQTFQDFEIIVVNDGSPDTEALERMLGPYLPRIVYLKQENRGPSGARNTGIRHARGKYLAFLDSDDCWLPDYLRYHMKMFEGTPSLDVVYCDAQYFGNHDLAGKMFMQMFPSNGPVTLQSLISKDCQVPGSCIVALKQIIVDAGLFDESLTHCEDYDLWLRILYRGGRIAYQKDVLARYRSRPRSLSQDAKKMSQTLVAVYEKTERMMDLPDETRTVLKNQLMEARASADLEVGRSFLAAKEFDRAKESLTKANIFFHRTKLKLVILGLQIAPRLTRLAVIVWQFLISGPGLAKSQSMNVKSPE